MFAVMAAQQTTVNPIGFFIRAPAALGPPNPVLADNIDPETRDFADLFVGADPIDAQVQHALTVIRDSGPPVEDFCIDPTPTKMSGSLEDEIESDVRAALATLVQNGDIQIVAITFDLVDETNQSAQVRTTYRNLRALDTQTREAKLPVLGKQLLAA